MRGNQTWDRIVKRIAASCRGTAKKRDRRRLFFEPLEGRQLLAGDLELTGAEYQNSDNPYDVNGDGTLAPSDAVVVANELAEGDSSYGFPDINGDSEVTAADMELVVEAVTEAMEGSAESSAASTSGTCIDLHVDPVAPIPEGSVFTISGHVDNYDDCQADTIWISRLDIDEWNYGDFGAFAAETFLQEDGSYDFDVTAFDSVSPGYPTDPEVLTVVVTNVAPQLTVTLTDTDGQPITEPINEGDTVRLEATIIDPGVLDDQTIVIDWGNGDSTSITREAPDPGETPWLDFWSPVEPQAGPLTFTEEFTYTFLDDDPTGTPSDSYTITVTSTDDDGGTDSQVVSITVNNVAPAVTITSITPIDSVPAEQGGVMGRLDETEGFIVAGTVTDPGINDTFPVAKLEVDLNWDGDVLDSGESIDLALNGGNGVWTFNQAVSQVQDDGASYDASGSLAWGNGTDEDPLAFSLTVEDDDTGQFATSSTITIANVNPIISGPINVTLVVNNGDAPDTLEITATVDGQFSDIGALDLHKLHVSWGDGVEGDGASDGNLVPTGSFSLTRSLVVSDDFDFDSLFPVYVEIEDDDLGWATKSRGVCSFGLPEAEGEGNPDYITHRALTWADFQGAPGILDLTSGFGAAIQSWIEKIVPDKIPWAVATHQSLEKALISATNFVKPSADASLVIDGKTHLLLAKEPNAGESCVFAGYVPFLVKNDPDPPQRPTALAVMDKSKSWVLPDVPNPDWVLNHEQKHFDLTNAYAERLDEEYVNLKTASVGSTVKNARNLAVNRYWLMVDSLHTDYRNGLSAAQDLYDDDVYAGNPGMAIDLAAQTQWNAWIASGDLQLSGGKVQLVGPTYP